MLIVLRGQVGTDRLDGAAAAAVLHRGVDRLVGVERDVGDLGVEIKRPVGEDHVQRVCGVGLVDRALDRCDGSLTLETADVDARNVDVRENGIAVFDREAIAAERHDRDQHDRAGDDADARAHGQARLGLFGLLGYIRCGMILRSDMALRCGLGCVLGAARGFKSAFLFDGDLLLF